MPKYVFSAHQEMFVTDEVEASSVQEAVSEFETRLRNKTIVCCPSDEDMDLAITKGASDSRKVRDFERGTRGLTVRA